MRLNVLICCYNASVEGVPSILRPPREDVRYVVSHQMSGEYAGAKRPEALDRPDVVYAPFVGRGLSANRNHCLDVLRNLEGKVGNSGATDLETLDNRQEICLIADDVVSYFGVSFGFIFSAFEFYVDIVAFRISSP